MPHASKRSRDLMVHLRHLFADCQVVVFSFKADTYDLTDENGKATRRLHGKVAVFSFNADTEDSPRISPQLGPGGTNTWVGWKKDM